MEVERPVIDKTGLTGTYDVDLRYTPEPRRRGAQIPGDLPDAVPGASIFTTIREQLGLKLVPVEDAIDVFVIASVSQPAPD